MDAKQVDLIRQAAELGVLNAEAVKHKRVAFTGKSSMSRVDMFDLVSALGGRPQSAITLTTQLLIVGDTGRHGETNKITTARLRGVRIMSEAEFKELIDMTAQGE